MGNGMIDKYAVVDMLVAIHQVKPCDFGRSVFALELHHRIVTDDPAIEAD